MSTNSSAAAQGMFSPSGLGRLRAMLTRWWVAYITWRIEQAASAQLGVLDDRQLKDIGVTRSSITGAVRVGTAGDRAFSRYY